MQMVEAKTKLVILIGLILTSMAGFSQASGGGFGERGGDLRLSLGGGVAQTQAYEGSNRFTTQFTPHFDLLLYDTVFLNVDDGLGLHLHRQGGTKLSLSVSYFEGRFERHDRDNLAGLGDIEETPIAIFHAEQVLGIVAPFVNARHYFGAIDGTKARLGLGTMLPLAKGATLHLSGGYEWADANYHKAFFGVSPDQAQASGLAEHSVPPGFTSKVADLSLRLALTKQWGIRVHGSYSLLIGDAADSPIVRQRSSLTGRLLLVYEF